jgi:nucleotidyltransferase substrate binding protein (TIGR01987 family)
MEKRLGYLIEQLHAAAQDFETSLEIDKEGLDPVVIDAVKNGQAQKFEFTIELFWKTVRAFLLDLHGFDFASPKSVVKKYFELGYCSYEDCEKLLRALDIRNSLTHIYEKEAFETLHREIITYRVFFGPVSDGMGGESS